MIAGVCLALARTNGWDVAVVRIVTVVAFFCSGGIVAIAYLAGWIGIPEEPFLLPGGYPPQGTYPPPAGTYPPSSGAYPPS
jgi:phage shock protein C